MRIAIVGGTGKEGRGLGLRWARAGHQLFIGSRTSERAQACAQELSALAGATVAGGDNDTMVRQAELVVLTVPYAAHGETLESLREALMGRTLIDLTVPLRPPKVSRVSLPEGLSAALEAQEIVDESTPVVAALHHVSSAHLGDPDHPIACDVLVCSDDAAAMERALALIGELGVRALDAGPLVNAIALESLTPVLIHLNKKYRSAGTGLRITGLP